MWIGIEQLWALAFLSCEEFKTSKAHTYKSNGKKANKSELTFHSIQEEFSVWSFKRFWEIEVQVVSNLGSTRFDSSPMGRQDCMTRHGTKSIRLHEVDPLTWTRHAKCPRFSFFFHSSMLSCFRDPLSSGVHCPGGLARPLTCFTVPKFHLTKFFFIARAASTIELESSLRDLKIKVFRAFQIDQITPASFSLEGKSIVESKHSSTHLSILATYGGKSWLFYLESNQISPPVTKEGKVFYSFWPST